MKIHLIVTAICFVAISASSTAPSAVLTIDEPAWYKDNLNGHAGSYFNEIRELGLTLTRGYAPFAVFFEGWESSPRNEITKWEWDFGAGTETDESGRTADGFNAAHVFETPGSYTVTLRTMNALGERSNPVTKTIEVLKRPVNGTYYVDSETGNDSFDGLSQSAGNGHGPWRTADKAFKMADRTGTDGITEWPLKPGDQVLFRRGQVFSLSIKLNAGHGRICQGIHYGSYGNGLLDKPVIQWAGDSSRILLGGSGDGEAAGIGGAFFSISDLTFKCWNKTRNTYLSGLLFAPSGWKNVLLLRCDFIEMRDAVWTLNGFDEDEPTGIFMISCSVRKDDSWSLNAGSVHLYGGPGRMALVNNKFDKSGNHIAYLCGVNKAVISHNTFSRPAFGRTALRITGGEPPINLANNIYIADNMFLGWIDSCTETTCPGTGSSGSSHNGGGNRYNYTLITFPPGANTGNLLMEHVLFERNVITNYEVGMSVSNTYDMIIRNNLFVTPIAGTALKMGNDNSRPLKDVFVYGNTFISGFSPNDQTPVIKLYPFTGGNTSYGNQHENIRLTNNIFAGYANANPPAAVDLDNSISGLITNNNLYYYSSVNGEKVFKLAGTSYNLTLWKLSTGLESGSLWANPQFYETPEAYVHARGEPSSLAANEAEGRSMITMLPLSAGSPAIDAGENLGAGLNRDFNAFVRPVDGNGDGTSVSDIGAFEYASTSALIPKRAIKAGRADVLVLNSSGPNDAIVLRINSGFRDQIRIRIIDAVGRNVHTENILVNTINGYRNNNFFDYRIGEKLADGLYTAVVSGKLENDDFNSYTRFVIIH